MFFSRWSGSLPGEEHCRLARGVGLKRQPQECLRSTKKMLDTFLKGLSIKNRILRTFANFAKNKYRKTSLLGLDYAAAI